MRAYRLFFFDAAEHIRGWTVLESQDDAEAVRMAEEKCDGRAMELWDRERLVHQFAADPTRTPRPTLKPPG